MSDTENKILEQVEFYFSDSNFPKDKFLREQASKNEEGYVSIETIASFARMKRITTDVKAIADALRKSEELQVNDEGTMVKRKYPLPSEDTSAPRTIYAKGFPLTATIEDIKNSFSKFGTVKSVRIRKTRQKEQKDSAFVEFSKAEEAQEAAKANAQHKYNDTPLIIMMKSDYWEKKKADREEQKEKKRKEKEEKEEEPPKKKQKKEEEGYTEGLIVAFSNVTEQVTREDLKEVFKEFGTLKFVDHVIGRTEGFLRFENPEEAAKAVQAVKERSIQIRGQEIKVEPVTGEKEKEYWEKIKEGSQRKPNKKGKRGRKRR